MAATRGAPEDGVAEIDYAYELSDSLEDKVLALARRVYNAADVSWSVSARGQLRRFREMGWGRTASVHGEDAPIDQRPAGAEGEALGIHVRGT